MHLLVFQPLEFIEKSDKAENFHWKLKSYCGKSNKGVSYSTGKTIESVKLLLEENFNCIAFELFMQFIKHFEHYISTAFYSIRVYIPRFGTHLWSIWAISYKIALKHSRFRSYSTKVLLTICPIFLRTEVPTDCQFGGPMRYLTPFNAFSL